MFYFEYDTKKLKEAEKNLRQTRDDLNRYWKKGRENVGEFAKERIQFHVPKKTRNLEKSVTIVKKGDDQVIGHDKDKTKTQDGKHSYGDIVYYGIRRGYWIYPKNASVLKFEVNGETIFAKKVYIPPRPGNKFIDRTVIDMRQNKVSNILVQELKKSKFITFK